MNFRNYAREKMISTNTTYLQTDLNCKINLNIGGNNFRMAAMVWIENERVYILKIMTHAEYDKEKF